MAVRILAGVVVEVEAEEEDVVAVAIETETDTYRVHPPHMAEELLDLMGRRVEVTGTIVEAEDAEPVIEVDSYRELFDDTEDLDEEEGEEEADLGELDKGLD